MTEQPLALRLAQALDNRQECEDEAAAELRRLHDEVELLKESRNGAYTERNKLVALLSTLFPSGIAKTAIEGWDESWHGCVYIDFPWGQFKIKTSMVPDRLMLIGALEEAKNKIITDGYAK